jgi:hypothetical protein
VVFLCPQVYQLLTVVHEVALNNYDGSAHDANTHAYTTGSHTCLAPIMS